MAKGAAAKKESKAKKVKDPNAPKRNKNGYMFYMESRRAEVKEKNPDFKIGDVAKAIGAEWKALGDAEKEPFLRMAEKDKARYTKEKAAYDAKQK